MVIVSDMQSTAYYCNSSNSTNEYCTTAYSGTQSGSIYETITKDPVHLNTANNKHDAFVPNYITLEKVDEPEFFVNDAINNFEFDMDDKNRILSEIPNKATSSKTTFHHYKSVDTIFDEAVYIDDTNNNKNRNSLKLIQPEVSKNNNSNDVIYDNSAYESILNTDDTYSTLQVDDAYSATDEITQNTLVSEEETTGNTYSEIPEQSCAVQQCEAAVNCYVSDIRATFASDNTHQKVSKEAYRYKRLV